MQAEDEEGHRANETSSKSVVFEGPMSWNTPTKKKKKKGKRRKEKIRKKTEEHETQYRMYIKVLIQNKE